MNQTTQHLMLQPARFRLDGGGMYGIIPRPLWEKHSPPDQLNRIDLSLRLWLIKSADKIVLIDTGIGDDHDQKFRQRFDLRAQKNSLEASLESLSLCSDDVTDLVITHLHFDHAGGMGKLNSKAELVPTFKNARLHLHKDHYKYALNPTDRDQGSFHHHLFVPIVDYYKKMNQLHWHSGKEGELIDLGDDKLSFKCSHGHTPWLMHPYSKSYIYLADLIPTSHHIKIPWVMGYDIAAGQTTIDKKEFLKFAHENKLKLIFEHDVDYWGASLVQDESGNFKAEKTFQAQDALASPLA